MVFFHGCGANYYEPDMGRRAVEVLEHNGLDVIIPRQGCCGLPLQSNGIFDDARRYVRNLAARLAPYARAGHDIVATSTSCGLMLKREAEEILGVEDADLEAVRSRLYDICEYLVAPARARRAADRLPTARPWRSPTTPPASSAATASARRRST